jgi:chemotaxis family two-component system response regulator Rcp1
MAERVRRKEEVVMHLLQIDDNRGDVALVRAALQDVATHVRLTAVPDGHAAFEFLGQCAPYTALPCPDVILLDLNLPHKHGAEVLAELRQHPRFKHIPIVIFTGTEEPREVRHCYELGANAVLRKPMDVAEYCALVRTCVAFWCACQVPRLSLVT